VATTRLARGVPVAKWDARSSPVPWMVAFVVVAAVAVWQATRSAAVTPRDVVRFEVQPPPGVQFAYPSGGVALNVALSADGKQVVYTANRVNGPYMLWLRDADRLGARPLAGTEYGNMPAFSPDGKWIAFVASEGTLKKIGADGMGLTSLCPMGPGGAAGITWVSDREIVFAKANLNDRGLWRVSADGGEARHFTQFDKASGERLQMSPHAIPGGRLVLYASSIANATNLRMGVADLETGKVTVFPTLLGAQPLGVASGQMIYVRSDGALMAAPFDQRALRVGAPVQLLDSIAVRRWEAAAALSESGTLVYQKGGVASQLVSVDEHGAAHMLVDSVRSYAHPRLSPDGRRLAFEVNSSSDVQIWVYDLVGRTVVRLTREGSNDRPEWSPDGARVMYSSTRANGSALWWQPSDGSAAETKVYSDNFSIREGVFTPDGRSIVYRVDTDTSNRDILMVPVGGGPSVPLLTSVADEKMPRVSPDGRWLAYVSDESGREEVYVRALTGGGRVPVSAGGGAEPLWSPDGRRLFYRAASKQMAASIVTMPALGVTSREMLFDIPFANDPYHPNYDVAADGRSFVMVRPVDSNRQLVMVVNWVEELRQRVGAKK
jgi:serine/threonine-protein kinase